MDEEMGDPDKLAIQIRPEGVQVRIHLEFAPHPVVHLGWLNALIKVNVRTEQGFPDRPVRWSEFADTDQVAFSWLDR